MPRCLLALILATTASADAPPLSFTQPEPRATPPGFGATVEAAKSPTPDDRDRGYARALLRKYDADGDRVLQEAEWRKIRGKPERADANGDGQITLDELTARVGKRRVEREAEAKKGIGKRDDPSPRRSYRLRSASEALPDGLPGWFADRDRNGDGQVAMHEYSRSWSDATARRFTRLDTDDDGLISPAEAGR